MTTKRIYLASLAVEAICAVRGVQYYSANRKG